MHDPARTRELALLVDRIGNGDSAAEGPLVEYFAPRVRAMLLARTRDADVARDLTQEALLAVLQAARARRIRDTALVIPYVLGVARNLLNNQLRQRRDNPEVPLVDDAAAPALEEDPAGEADERRLLGRALETLAAPDRQVLLLTLVEGLKPGEIGRRLGLSSEVVRQRKSRALKRVLEALGGLSRVRAVYHSTEAADDDRVRKER